MMASLLTLGLDLASLLNILDLECAFTSLDCCVLTALALAAAVSMPRSLPEFSTLSLIPDLMRSLEIAVVMGLWGKMVLLSERSRCS